MIPFIIIRFVLYLLCTYVAFKARLFSIAVLTSILTFAAITPEIIPLPVWGQDAILLGITFSTAWICFNIATGIITKK